jgi:hypothetical protein
VVQDLPELRKTAESYIKSQGLQELMKFEAQNLFSPQQRKGKYVFVIQRMLHDWRAEDGVSILRQLKDVLNDDVGGPSQIDNRVLTRAIQSASPIIDSIIMNGVIESNGS